MGWTVSDEGFPSISPFNNVFVDSPFFQITSDDLIPCFPVSPSGKTTANLEGSPFTRPSTLFHSLHMTKPLHFSVLKTFPHALQF